MNSRFLIYSFVILFVLSHCGPADDPAPETEPDTEVEAESAPEAEAELYQDEDTYSFADLNYYAHGIYMASAISRESEMGHENYRPELFQEPMRMRAEQWLDLTQWIEQNLSENGRLFESIARDVSEVDETLNLANYQPGIYNYHMHHRGEWYEHHEMLDERIFRQPAQFISDMGIYLLGEHYDDGLFYHDTDQTEYDHTSMSFGLEGIHGHIYAWIRWQKPGGEDDMGQLTEDYLITWLRHGPDGLTHYSRQIAEQLDHYWDDDAGIYDFGSGTTYSLDELGGLLRGKKAVYEMLYMFGGDRDEEAIQTMFDRGAQILESVLGIAQPWGMPAEITFENGEATAASEEVDLTKLYTFMNTMSGGFSYDREREGTSFMLEEQRPDLLEALGDFSDDILQASIDDWQHNGALVSAVDFETGEITDDRHKVGPIGMFITAAGNAYRSGDAFERAQDWDEVSDDVQQRSEELYDAIVSHVELLEEQYELPDLEAEP